MTTRTVTVTAPSSVTRKGFLVAIKERGGAVYTGSTNWLRLAADKTGATKAIGFTRKYLGKAWNLASTVARAAGFVPLAVLTVSSRTGQKTIKSTAKTGWSAWTWGANLAVWGIDRFFRLFGKPGNALADKAAASRRKMDGLVKSWAHNISAVVGPLLSPELIYMKVAKVISYAMVSVGIVSTFVTGLWAIPAYIAVALLGLALSPTVRRSVMVSRLTNVFEDDAKAQARAVITEAMEAMIAEYGPEMSKWNQAEKAEYATKQAIRRALDGHEDPYVGLTNNQKRKAMKWLRDFEAGLHHIASDLLAAAEGGTLIDPETGQIIVNPDLAQK